MGAEECTCVRVCVCVCVFVCVYLCAYVRSLCGGVTGIFEYNLNEGMEPAIQRHVERWREIMRPTG